MYPVTLETALSSYPSGHGSMINDNGLRDGHPAEPPGVQHHETSQALCVRDNRQQVPLGGKTPPSRRLSPSVIDSAGKRRVRAERRICAVTDYESITSGAVHISRF